MWYDAVFVLGLCALGCGAPAAASEPLSELNGRSVLSPTRFGVLSSLHDTAALPSAVPVGAKTAGRVLMYFEFEQPRETRKLLRAQLLLGTAQAGAESVAVELSRSGEAGAELSRWSDQPKALYPRLSLQLGAAAGSERLDVTEILLARAGSDEPLRLLLRAEPGEGEGVLVATGASGGWAPRLELYWQ